MLTVQGRNHSELFIQACQAPQNHWHGLREDIHVSCLSAAGIVALQIVAVLPKCLLYVWVAFATPAFGVYSKMQIDGGSLTDPGPS
mmetsp:Transcript_9805/g.25386  ORF Transcript_9805/g.25386 Transcript_9805/m.25386 type:complete len:86 (+) Transcript_9805:772-1029(+)